MSQPALGSCSEPPPAWVPDTQSRVPFFRQALMFNHGIHNWLIKFHLTRAGLSAGKECPPLCRTLEHAGRRVIGREGDGPSGAYRLNQQGPATNGQNQCCRQTARSGSCSSNFILRPGTCSRFCQPCLYTLQYNY
ncbi:hypothetical protein PoB_000826300 [Plakobranchus ocellatus]|uniref:ShKT domain-containing protein n=1 Tax=Plakobranchus ocellatus TaxID=259542 RepID=A0AAV3YHV7_9GAST|nr:hypothetical protein PoB_000826300 [Plakobranchus ocellatus]